MWANDETIEVENQIFWNWNDQSHIAFFSRGNVILTMLFIVPTGGCTQKPCSPDQRCQIIGCDKEGDARKHIGVDSLQAQWSSSRHLEVPVEDTCVSEANRMRGESRTGDARPRPPSGSKPLPRRAIIGTYGAIWSSCIMNHRKVSAACLKRHLQERIEMKIGWKVAFWLSVPSTSTKVH